ncbi:hypothetical protein BKA61DRAFT_717249 [Leptodontidium sp. MPI-SDFR-AT-0119]|nr:hypothetical protein BKA61DRAFT_717249 [Leptodontidium sp. MPI-SDFR-AT-0119]
MDFLSTVSPGIPNITVTTPFQWNMSRLAPLLIEPDPSTTRGPLETFEQFMQLPSELRLLIWGYIARQPRKVKLLECSLRHFEPSSAHWNSNVEGQSRHPAMMQVCSESRNEGLRYYTVCRDRVRYVVYRNQLRKFGRHMSNTFFINFNLDVFIHGSSQFQTWDNHFPGQHSFNFGLDILSQIQHIEQLPCYREQVQNYSSLWMATMFDAVIFRTSIWKNLKDVTLVHNDYGRYCTMETTNFHSAMLDWKDKVERRMRMFPTCPETGSLLYTTPNIPELVTMEFELCIKWKWPTDYKLEPCKPRRTWRDPDASAEIRTEGEVRQAEFELYVMEVQKADLAQLQTFHRFGSC